MAFQRVYDPTPQVHGYGPRSSFKDVDKNYSIGVTPFVCTTLNAELHGARYYSAKTGSHRLNLRLWTPNQTTPPLVRDQEFTMDGPGFYDLKWDDPFIFTQDKMVVQNGNNPTVETYVLALYAPDFDGYTYLTTVGDNQFFLFLRQNIGWCYTQIDTTSTSDSAGPGNRPSSGLSGGPVPLSPLFVPPANMIYEPTPAAHCHGEGNPNIVLREGLSARTIGYQNIQMLGPGLVYGCRFYTAYTGTQDIKFTLWRKDKTVAATKTQQFSAAGTYDLLLDTPYRVTVADMNYRAGGMLSDWRWGLYHPAGNITSVPSSKHWAYVSAQLSWQQRYNVFAHTNNWVAGDTYTNGGTEAHYYPMNLLTWADHLVTP